MERRKRLLFLPVTSAVCIYFFVTACGHRNHSTVRPQVRITVFQHAAACVKGRAMGSAYLEAELISTEVARGLRPSVTATKGSLDDLVIAPNNRRLRCHVSAAQRGNGYATGGGELRLRFPFKAFGDTRRVEAVVPLHFYSAGTVSIGANALPRSMQSVPALSAVGSTCPEPVVINREGDIMIEGNRDDTVGLPLGHPFVLLISSEHVKRTRLVRCLNMHVPRGHIEDRDAFEEGVWEFWYYPFSKRGTMQQGTTRLDFTFDVERGTTRRQTVISAKIVISPDGTSRLVNLCVPHPDLSPPKRDLARRYDSIGGQWIPVTARTRVAG